MAPVACAMHCMLAPALVLIAPAFVSPEVEWGFLGGTVALGGVAMLAGLRTHGDARPLLPLLAGLVLWGLSLAGAFGPVPEDLTTAAAALTAATGLIWNSRLHCASTGPGCSACAEEVVDQEAGIATCSTARKSASG
jgi:hypothetical protein